MHQATQDTARANDKATENAVCILRNLSYRLAAEIPDLKEQLDEVMSTDSDFMDCFGNWKKNKKKQRRDVVGFPRFHRVPGQGKIIALFELQSTVSISDGSDGVTWLVPDSLKSDNSLPLPNLFDWSISL